MPGPCSWQESSSVKEEPLGSYQAFFLYDFAFGLWEASNLGLSPYRAAFYFTYLLIYFLARGFVPWFLGMGSMPWWDSCALVLTVSKSLVSHDLACPQVSPSLPYGPRPGFLPLQSTVAAVAVPWCLVTSSEGRGQLNGCNFSPWWKARGSEGGSLGCVNRCTRATSLVSWNLGESTASRMFGLCGDTRATAGNQNFNKVSLDVSNIFTPKLWEDPKSPVCGSSRELDILKPQIKYRSTALNITCGLLLISWGSCAKVCSHCNRFENHASKTPVNAFVLTCILLTSYLFLPLPPPPNLSPVRI